MYTIKLEAQQMEIILQGLSELPLKQSIDVFFEVRKQIAEQAQEQQGEMQMPPEGNNKPIEPDFIAADETQGKPSVKASAVK